MCLRDALNPLLILCYDLATGVPFVLSWVEAVEERQRHRYVVVAEARAQANGVDERREASGDGGGGGSSGCGGRS